MPRKLTADPITGTYAYLIRMGNVKQVNEVTADSPKGFETRITLRTHRAVYTYGMDAEKTRLKEDNLRRSHWKRWGPYLSERQWGTVREDYSADGNCWDYFPHDHARSRAYRWGEDGLLGITDEYCRLCLGVALWNTRDPILKERLFGLTGHQGNHGEDVKELYYYLDSTPTHSYMKALYKYPQAEYPYSRLEEENRTAGLHKPEVEILDTGLLDNNEYWDVCAEYCKKSPNDILCRYTLSNRGPAQARLHFLPTVWFRNIWSWGAAHERRTSSLIPSQKNELGRDVSRWCHSQQRCHL